MVTAKLPPELTVVMSVEGVLRPLYYAMAYWHDVRYGTHLHSQPLDPKIWSSIWVEEVWGGSAEEAGRKMQLFWQECDEVVGFDAWEPTAGSVLALQGLRRDYGYRFVAISGLATELYGRTRIWLDRFFPGLIDQLVTTDEVSPTGRRITKPEAFRTLVDRGIPVLAIEHRGDQADAYATAGIPTLVLDLFAWCQTSDHRLISHVSDWDEALGVIPWMVEASPLRPSD